MFSQQLGISSTLAVHTWVGCLLVVPHLCLVLLFRGAAWTQYICTVILGSLPSPFLPLSLSLSLIFLPPSSPPFPSFATSSPSTPDDVPFGRREGMVCQQRRFAESTCPSSKIKGSHFPTPSQKGHSS